MSKLQYKESAIKNETKLIQTLNDLEELKSQYIHSNNVSAIKLESSCKLDHATSLKLNLQEPKDTMLDFTDGNGLSSVTENKVNFYTKYSIFLTHFSRLLI